MMVVASRYGILEEMELEVQLTTEPGLGGEPYTWNSGVTILKYILCIYYHAHVRTLQTLHSGLE